MRRLPRRRLAGMVSWHRNLKLSPFTRAWRYRALALTIAAFALCATPSSAQTPKPDAPSERRYSTFELERIRRALRRVGGEIDENPEGKRIESIEVVALDVFEQEDPQPHFLNWFHVTTQDYVIEREVLFRIGEPFDQRRSDETERNLRSLFLFSVVLAIPVTGSTPQSIRYVVVTKDLWSLRVGWNGTFNKGRLEFLSMQPTERNLFGSGRQAFSTLAFRRRTYTLGLGYVEPRVAGSRTRIIVQANLIVNCQRGEVEGSSGSFQYSKPLYSTLTPWSYATTVSWNNSRVPLRVGSQPEGSICSATSSETLGFDAPNGRRILIPNEYLYDSQSFTQSFTRSYGYRYKTNLSFGLESLRAGTGPVQISRIHAEDGGPLDEREALLGELVYLNQIPPADKRISPFFQLTSFTTNFHRDINSETLALQEDVDFRLGHIASLRLYPALRALGSTRDLLGIETSASYADSVGTGYYKARVSHDVELSQRETTDASLTLAFRFTSPRMALGRFVYDARLTDHYRNYRRTVFSLGGTNRLRGYRNVAASGSHYVASNLEFRSRPVELLGAQFAGVLFYDVGDAFRDFTDMQLKHGVGVGVRFLAPQLDRDVFRIDFGMPVPFDTEAGELTLIATFGQAFGLP